MNAYEQLEMLRDFIGEVSASNWSSLNLLRRLNMSQRKYESIIAKSAGDWLVKSASITISGETFSFPSDCGKPLYLEDSSGNPIPWLEGGVSYRRVSRTTGASLSDVGEKEVYLLKDTGVVNSTNFSGTATLWYQQRVPDLHLGYADSGSGSNTLVFDKSTSEVLASNNYGTGLGLKYIDDYYNNVMVEVIDDSTGIVDIRSEISDWVASTATAIIVGTPAENDIYATVSELPEECHHLMVLDATVLSLIKPGAKLDKEALQHYRDELRRASKEFSHWIETRHAGPSYLAMGEIY